MKVVFVGAVACGASAAARLRRLDEKAQIVMFEKTSFMSYANCGLPYFLGDVIKEKSKLTLQNPKSFFDRYNILVKCNHEVISIDREKKLLTVKDLANDKIFTESYDKLVLATGAKPLIPEITGVNSSKVFSVRTVEDVLKISDFIKQNDAKNAVVVGGGFVGVETAENLSKIGINVTLIQRGEQLLSTLDREIASFVHNKIRENNINLMLNTSVESLLENDENIEVNLSDKTFIKADLIIFAIGVLPDNDLAKTSGIELSDKDSILVTDKNMTSDENIFAGGDNSMIFNAVTNKKALVPLASPASKQGRVIGSNLANIDKSYKGAYGSSIIKVFDITAASTGLNEREAKKAQIDYDTITITTFNHATYYPDFSSIVIKIIFDKKDFTLLGAEAVGKDGVDKKIDVLSTAIFAKMKAYDLAYLDLVYAPPYGMAKDGINILGFIADNLASGILKQFYINDIENVQKEKDALKLDVRTKAEFDCGHIDGFINIPLDNLRARIDEIKEYKKAYVICQSGMRSYVASRILESHNIKSYSLSGGYSIFAEWEKDKSAM